MIHEVFEIEWGMKINCIEMRVIAIYNINGECFDSNLIFNLQTFIIGSEISFLKYHIKENNQFFKV